MFTNGTRKSWNQKGNEALCRSDFFVSSHQVRYDPGHMTCCLHHFTNHLCPPLSPMMTIHPWSVHPSLPCPASCCVSISITFGLLCRCLPPLFSFRGLFDSRPHFACAHIKIIIIIYKMQYTNMLKALYSKT